MQIGILGPLQVLDDNGLPVEIAGARLRTLLARLALAAGRPVGTATLVDAVWGSAPPADQANALQTLVSRVRRALGDPAAIVASAAGYRLAITPDDVDAHRFERLVSSGSAALRRGDAREASGTLEKAMALRRGPALADSGADTAAARRLDDLHLAAQIEAAAAALDLGRPDLAGLETLAAEHPLDERLAGLLMRALAAAGRQADALRTHEALRCRLADDLGVDPSAELQQLHLALVRGELAPAVSPEAAGARRTNLKAQLTSFVGRDAEVARIAKTLEQSRLVTLVGPGGAGKTRLAAESAERIVDTAPDGVWLVELATVTAGADVPQAVLGSVGLREVHLMDRGTSISPRDALGRLRDGLTDRCAVLVLDNCEHVVEAAAGLAEQLLGDCPGLRVLATSREPLGILGETLLAVPPLGQPSATASAAEALEYPAVRLFADRAAAVRPDFTVDERTVGPVIEIVRRLDGLPLAIELAAARLRTMALEDVAERLSDRFRLLTGGSRTALPRHRTLRAVVEWSWDLLGADERALVERLSVFPSGVTIESATSVRPPGVDAREVPDLLGSLIDKSLLQPIGDGRRTRMLETIREYASEQLGERGELGRAREQHADHFAALVSTASPHLTAADQLPWFATLTEERENILAALRFRCDVGDADGARTLAVEFAWYAMMLGDHGEITDWVSDALAVPGGTDRTVELVLRALHALNSAASTDDDHGSSREALAIIAAELDGIAVDAHPGVALLRPAVAYFAGDKDLMVRFAGESLGSSDAWTRAATRMFLAMLSENEGDIAAMRAHTEAALAQFRAIGERWGTASTLRTMGTVLTLDGDLDGAAEAYEEALSLVDELHSTDDKIFVYGRLTDLALRRGDLVAARGYAELARAGAEDAGGGMEAIFSIALLGEIDRRMGGEDKGRAAHAEAMRKMEQLPPEHPMRGHMRSMLLAMAANIALDDGELDGAGTLAREAVQVALGTHDNPVIAIAAVSAAALEAARGRPEAAAEVLGAAAALRGADDFTALDVADLRRSLADALGEPGLAAAYGRGRALAQEQALARLVAAGG